MKSIVVTGASTGIGWGCTKVLVGKGVHVFGSVRKQADADRLKAEFGERFTPLQFETETREEARRVQFDASALRASVKAFLGVSEFAVTVVAQKTLPH